MEGISRNLRLRTAAAVSALFAAAVVAMAMAASASALVYTHDISIRVVDNTTHHSARVAFCPNGHVNLLYPLGTVADPCLRIPYSTTIGANGGRYPTGPWPGTTYTANPLGVIVTLSGEGPMYFFVKNPILGLPFFEASAGPASCSTLSPCTHVKARMVQGELHRARVGNNDVRFHREGDISVNGISYKVMTIEICGANPANCR